MALRMSRMEIVRSMSEGYGSPVPPEIHSVNSAVLALDGDKDEEFLLVSEEDEEGVPEWLNAFGTECVALWQGDQKGSLGYGSIHRFRTSHGAGLRVDLGGCPALSAHSTYIISAKLGWIFGL